MSETTTVMAETTNTLAKQLSTRIKTLIGTAAGLLSGAVMMYVSPLIQTVVKPGKPVANFGADVQGLTANFNNRSAGSTGGWWDFGDGSPLEPVTSKSQTISHAFPRPGNYNVKLTVRNLFGDESDRTIPVQIEQAQSVPPEILSLKAEPVSPGAIAPATFRVVSRTKNADLCIWNYDDDKPLEIVPTGASQQQERFITLRESGGHIIKMAAVHGGQAVEKSAIVYVNEQPDGTLTAQVSVTDRGTRVERAETPVTVPLQFPPQSNASVEPFDKSIPCRPGFDLVEATLVPSQDAHVRNLHLDVDQDKHSARLTGELVREAGSLFRSAPSPTVFVQVTLTQEKRTPATREPLLVTTMLTVPGAVLLPLPALPTEWVDSERQVKLELHEKGNVMWQDAQMPRKTSVKWHDRQLLFSASQLGDQVKIELSEPKNDSKPAGQVPTAN
jgi:PKD repeat protein